MTYLHLFPSPIFRRLKRRIQRDPKHWACQSCNSVHQVHHDDVPGHSSYGCPKVEDEHSVWEHVTGGTQYRFRPRHHEILLKYARNYHHLGFEQQAYYHSLLEPFTDMVNLREPPKIKYPQWKVPSWYSRPPQPTRRRLSMIVRPRVLVQSPETPSRTEANRLVVKFTWMYVAEEGQGPAKAKDLDGFQLCPHSRCTLDQKNKYNGTPDTLDHVFTKQVLRAFDQPNSCERSHWCPVCLVDYSIEASVNTNVVVVRAWYDLLSEDASGDPHLVDIPQLDYSRLYKKEQKVWGGIRDLFENGVEVEKEQPASTSPWKKLKGPLADRGHRVKAVGHECREHAKRIVAHEIHPVLV
ncbi:hypothetical protein B0T11DRAFT_317551 [Plectosphaerella cucumerina]|uniref:Uncharacterized protein n=1 Tax=Plectosphaerella cucumerina TaxID=40658 RepID=A0A8K0X2H9_9PEZI|nr:hypothetical protein B0T11DRAFT_317551 [Plectosphaerella cucumerina]